MYQVADSQALARGGRALVRRRTGIKVSTTVVLLGLTSMFTDISSEMVTAILPLYLIFTLGLSPLQFGVIDGIQQGASALVRVASGYTADRFGRYKEVAVFGYGLSAITRIGFILVGRSWALIGALVFADRTGKGIRTAPRDALISLSTPEEDLGTAFGVHRALDTAGAVIGPLIAFSLLVLIPHDFDPIFFVSFCFALIGLAILVLFVQNTTGRVEAEPLPPVTMRSVAQLLAVPRFGALLVAGGALALMTMSDGFVYLGLQQNLDFAGRNLPLLYVATSLVYMLLAIPAGRLADRVGRAKVFVCGYLLLLVVYAAIMVPGARADRLAGRHRRVRRLLRGHRRRAQRAGERDPSRRGEGDGPVGAGHGDEPRAARGVDRVRGDLGADRHHGRGRGVLGRPRPRRDRRRDGSPSVRTEGDGRCLGAVA